MKQLIPLLLFVASLTACTKEKLANRQAAELESKIQFSLYNDTKTYFDVNAGSQEVTGENVYSFVGTMNPKAENFFNLTFMTDSLQPGMYPINTGVVNFRQGNKVVSNAFSNDFVVTITSNVNGLVNGTFKGTLYDHETGSSCAVVNGIIENIQLYYRK